MNLHKGLGGHVNETPEKGWKPMKKGGRKKGRQGREGDEYRGLREAGAR